MGSSKRGSPVAERDGRKRAKECTGRPPKVQRSRPRPHSGCPPKGPIKPGLPGYNATSYGRGAAPRPDRPVTLPTRLLIADHGNSGLREALRPLEALGLELVPELDPRDHRASWAGGGGAPGPRAGSVRATPTRHAAAGHRLAQADSGSPGHRECGGHVCDHRGANDPWDALGSRAGRCAGGVPPAIRAVAGAGRRAQPAREGALSGLPR